MSTFYFQVNKINNVLVFLGWTIEPAIKRDIKTCAT